MSGSARGLFLDLDGTLADSVPLLRKVYHQFLEGFGRRGSDAEFETLNGPPLDVAVARLRATHGLEPDEKALLGQYHEMVHASYLEAPVRSGVRELLAEASGFRVAVVTSAPVALARAWLRRAGLDGSVDAVVGGDEVERGKPDPEPYRRALERTGCAAATSLAVEDSRRGAASAVAAGLTTWVLGAPGGDPWPAVAGFVSGLEELRPLLADV